MNCKFQYCVVLLLVVTIVGNFYFLHTMMQSQQQEIHFQHQARHEDGHVSFGEERVHEHVAVKVSKQLNVEAYSSRFQVLVKLDSRTIYNKEYKEGEDQGRGIHAIVLHSNTGALLSSAIFDTYASDAAFSDFLDQLAEGRILVLTIRDEGTFSLKAEAKAKLAKLGSKQATQLKWRDTWCMVVHVGQPTTLQEQREASKSIDTWAKPVTVRASIDALDTADCDWDSARRLFCDQYDGYGQLCSCHSPSKLPVGGTPLAGLTDVPVAIIASANRPQYLYKALTILLAAEGSDRSLTRVYIDGFNNPEVIDVCRMLGIKGIMQEPHGKLNGRISQHYLHALTDLFGEFPSAGHAIILEEDLAVAPDFFHFFEQTRPLLEQDSSVYVVSAWNDLGYKHTAKDPAMLMRVDTMPGLGWMLKRELFVKELKPKWPSEDKLWDWDMWMRADEQRKRRSSIIPDISRTFHFGAHGLNINDYFQEAYFTKHLLADVKQVKLATEIMPSQAYDQHLHELLSSAVVVDSSKTDPCKYKEAIPRASSQQHVIFIKQRHRNDWGTWMSLAKCFKTWDLDARGFYKSLWRLFLNGTPVLIVGSDSPFYSHKPSLLEPYFNAKELKRVEVKR